MLDSLFGQQSTWLDTFHSYTSNPLNLFLLAVLLYISLPLLLPSSPISSKWTPTPAQARSYDAAPSDRYTYLPPSHPDVIEWTIYTPRTLAVFDGSTQPRILLAINRKVFDVTKGATFYGPGGPYGNFAGRDASRGMAKQSFDLDMLTPLDRKIDTLEDLTPSEVKNMREWESHFTGKYGIIGELVDEEM